MPLRINSADNAYAQRVYKELTGRENHQVDDLVAGQQQEEIAGGDDHAADGLLTRTLQNICREKGAEFASQLQNLYVATTVNLNLDHSDEVDGGASTKKMDDDWVDIDMAPDLLKGPDKKEDSADQVAQRTMAALENVTVGQILDEYKDLVSGLDDQVARAKLNQDVYKGEGDTVSGKIAAAIKAQEELGARLEDLSANLRKLGNEGAASGAEDEARRARFCAQQLKELIVRIVKDGEDAIRAQGIADEKVVDALSKEMLTVGDRAKREMTEKAVRILDAKLADLGTAYAEVAAKKGQKVSEDELNRLEQGLAQAKKDLADAQDGIELEDADTGQTLTLEGLDKSVLRNLKARIDTMAADVARLRADALDDSIKKVYAEFPFDLLDSPIFSEANIAKSYKGKPQAQLNAAKAAVEGFRNDLTALKAALDECRRSGDASQAKAVADQIAQANYGVGLYSHLMNLGLPEEEGLEIVSRLPFLDLNGQGQRDTEVLKTLIGRFEDMSKKANDVAQTSVDGALLARVLDGTCGLATAASASAWGANAHLLEPGVDDRNLVHCRELGKGAYNKVTLCTYRREDGTTVRRVFKPELPARRGWDKYSMNEESFGKRGPLKQVAQTNVDVHKTAESLGVGNSVVGAHLGVHDGQFGLMMDVAEGVSGERLTRLFANPPKDPEKVMVGKKSLKDLMDILSANDERATKFVGNLRHAYTDLDWLDRIIGQSDRHEENYMISVGDDLSVRVTGIDNDLCFPEGVSEDKRVYPSAISQGMFDKLSALADALRGKDTFEAQKEVLSDKLKINDLTERQCTALVERIRDAFEAANSPECEKVPENGSWLNMDNLVVRNQAQPSKDNQCDFFTHHVIRRQMLSLPFDSDGGTLAPLEKDSDRQKRIRTRRLFDILRDQDAEGRMIQAANGGDPAVSKAELQAFFTSVVKKPEAVFRDFGEWTEENLNSKIEAKLVDLCRAEKRRLGESIRSNDELEEDDQVVTRCHSQYFRICMATPIRFARDFAMGLAVVNGQNPPLTERELALLGDGGALELAPFMHELQAQLWEEHRIDVNGDRIAEALISELRSEFGKNPDYNPDEAEVGRLRRLVANKLKVSPEEVLKPKEAKKLTTEQLARFRKACAITPTGKDYYAQVRANYGRLKS